MPAAEVEIELQGSVSCLFLELYMRANMFRQNLGKATALAAFAIASPAFAGTLQVSPIGIELGQGIATTTENLENKGTNIINGQARIFKWESKDGKDSLTPTTDVVASPPALKIQPGGKATLRIVRLSKAPIVGEESYRLIIDDIPPPPDKPGDAVTFAVRHAIPVFFQAPGIKSALTWTANIKGDELDIAANNAGDLHARLSALVVSSGAKPVVTQNGLVGYVLGHEAMHWTYKVNGVHAGTTLTLKAAGNDGSVDTTIIVK